MASPDPAFFAGLPLSVQWAINIAIFIGVLIASIKGFKFGTKIVPEVSTKDVVLTGGTIADMTPVKEIQKDIKRLADSMAGIHSIMLERQHDDKEADENQLRNEVRDLKRMLAEKDPGISTPIRRGRR